jgi:dual specificity protein kinase YAK1
MNLGRELTYLLASRPNAPQLPPIQSTMAGTSYHPQSAPLTLSPYTRELNSSSAHRQPQQLPNPQIGKGPVPKFTKCLSISELQPRINEQPAFRRAKPEGGFLSVCPCFRNCQNCRVLTCFPAPSSLDDAIACDLQDLQS